MANLQVVQRWVDLREFMDIEDDCGGLMYTDIYADPNVIIYLSKRTLMVVRNIDSTKESYDNTEISRILVLPYKDKWNASYRGIFSIGNNYLLPYTGELNLGILKLILLDKDTLTMRTVDVSNDLFSLKVNFMKVIPYDNDRILVSSYHIRNEESYCAFILIDIHQGTCVYIYNDKIKDQIMNYTDIEIAVNSQGNILIINQKSNEYINIYSVDQVTQSAKKLTKLKLPLEAERNTRIRGLLVDRNDNIILDVDGDLNVYLPDGTFIETINSPYFSCMKCIVSETGVYVVKGSYDNHTKFTDLTIYTPPIR